MNYHHLIHNVYTFGAHAHTHRRVEAVAAVKPALGRVATRVAELVADPRLDATLRAHGHWPREIDLGAKHSKEKARVVEDKNSRAKEENEEGV